MTKLVKKMFAICLIFFVVAFCNCQQFNGNSVKPSILSAAEILIQTVTTQSKNFGLNTDFRAIYPGTKWCGDNDVANTKGGVSPIFPGTDSCCRDHDHCRVYIEAGKTAYGLYNNGPYSKAHCDCDSKFYNCLKRVSSPVAIKIGVTYFDVLKPQCFAKGSVTGKWQWYNNLSFVN